MRLPCLRSFVLIEAPRDVCGGIFLWCFFWFGVGFLGFGFWLCGGFLVWCGFFGFGLGFWTLVLLVRFFTDAWVGGLRFSLVYRQMG